VDDASRLARYHAAVRSTDALIDTAYAPAGTSLAEITARAAHRMERTRSLLRDLGDPFDGIPIVHVGGTSGKGSTSVFIHSILTEAGFRTGLHTSPYLQVATEKLQINGQLIDPVQFADLVEHVLSVASAWSERNGERLTYGEIWMGLIGCFFRDERVEIGVLEVGAGGRFDLSNIISPVLSVVTSVGMDHTQTLGDTIELIAWHKAGIIKPCAAVVTAVDDDRALPAIYDEARQTGSRVVRVIEGETFSVEQAGAAGVTWRERNSGQLFRTGMAGRFQATNAATAVAASRELQALGFTINDEAITDGIAYARIPGRAEFMQRRPLVLLDGAHNPQKVAAIARDIPALLPVGAGGRRIALIGMLDAKAHAEAMSSLLPVIDLLILTSPHVLAKGGLAADRLAAEAREQGFQGTVLVEPEPSDALSAALALATPADALVVTGSLYLVGNLRGYWQPDDDIVLARTPWPRSAGA
jgi:dihydrofolate synthase/folylpolyglutamate synthase